MIYHTIAEILDANKMAYSSFIASISKLSEEQAHFRLENQWTIAEIVEHLSIVNEGILAITHKLLKAAESEPKPPKADLNLGHTSLDENGQQQGKIQAPERVQPRGGVRIEDSLPKLESTLGGFAAIQSRLEAVDLSDHSFPHIVLGPINGYKLLILLGEHIDRHRGQIEKLKQSAEFPTSS